MNWWQLFKGEAKVEYKRERKKIHIIHEHRSDDFEICHPKIVEMERMLRPPLKAIIHYREDGSSTMKWVKPE